MEAIALRKSFENLGLQLLFSEVGLLVGIQLPEELPSEEKQALLDLKEFLRTAINGLELVSIRRSGGYKSLATLKDSIKAERAYTSVKPVLPSDFEEAKALLSDLETIVEKIIKGESIENDNRKRLHTFCRRMLSYLDRDRFETL